MSRRDPNPQSQQASGRRTTSSTALQLGSAFLRLGQQIRSKLNFPIVI